MNERELLLLADQLQSGQLSKEKFIEKMKEAPFQDLGEIKLDHHRALRKGFAEIVYCPGKSDEQLLTIAQAVKDRTEAWLFSRVSGAQADLLKTVLPDLTYHKTARMGGLRRPVYDNPCKGLTVIAAGSSDVPVAEEAAITAEYMGCEAARLYDVGVAGIHRLLAHASELMESKAIVAVAGMEGALPGVVAGLVSCPVIAVPTSVGYGANFHGLSALLTMINSCATGVSVVNIDNGLGGGYQAAQIVRQAQ